MRQSNRGSSSANFQPLTLLQNMKRYSNRLRQKARLIYPEWRRMEESENQREQKETKRKHLLKKKKTASKMMNAMSSIYCSNKHVF